MAARRALRERLALPADRPVVLSVGWISRAHKRMDYVVEEVARLPAPRPFLMLLGAMDRSSDEIIRLAHERLGPDGFAARSVPYHEVAHYYAAADCFVLASLSEGFGRVFLEALAHGLPVIAHEHPVMRYVLGRARGPGRSEPSRAPWRATCARSWRDRRTRTPCASAGTRCGAASTGARSRRPIGACSSTRRTLRCRMFARRRRLRPAARRERLTDRGDTVTLDFQLAACLTGIALLAAAWLAYVTTRDTLHPMIYLAGMAFFLHAFLPLYLELTQPDELRGYLGQDQLDHAQTIVFLGVLSLCWRGVVGRARRRTALAMRRRRERGPPSSHRCDRPPRPRGHGARALGPDRLDLP